MRIVPLSVLAAFLAVIFARPATGAPNPYGTTSHLTRTGYGARQSLCAKLAESGAGWMRMDFDWRVLEREPGRWDFSRCDDILATAESNTVQVIGILGGPPDRCDRVWECLDDWKRFVRRVATRYRGRLPVYEIWNEENAREFWHFEPNATNYLAILKTAYETLKEVDPSVRVALGSLTKHGLPFGEELYGLGAASYFDIMNVHPYSEHPERPWPEGDLDVWLAKLKALMSRFGDQDKEIWITEIGWPVRHEPRLIGSGILQAGLRALAPERRTWRTLVVDPLLEHPGWGEAVVDLVRRELPIGSEVVGCGFSAFRRRLQEVNPDLLVVTPRTQSYPVQDGQVIVDFAFAGGIIADLGGVPFYSGLGGERGNYAPQELRRRLHFDAHCWWMADLPSVPKEILVRPTAAAADVTCPPSGLIGKRFVTDRYLCPGDRFVPLLEARWTNGVACVAAAAIGYPKGGGVIVSGLIEPPIGVFSEIDQARYLPCAHLLAFESGVSTVMWYELRSHDYDRRDDGWGLLHVDLSEKPAWVAYRTLIAHRPAGSVQVPVALRKDGVRHVAWRRPDGRRAGALWTEGALKPVTVNLGGRRIVFVDFLGRDVRLEKTDEKEALMASGEVVYYIESNR